MELPSQQQRAASNLVDEMMDEGLAYDPVGLAAKYGVDADVDGLDGDSCDSCSDVMEAMVDPDAKHAEDLPRCSRPQAEVSAAIKGSGGVDNKAPARLSGAESSRRARDVDDAGINGTNPALEELQNQNVRLLEAVESKSRQVQRLGTLMEALEPVPGLDPEAFFKVLAGGGGEVGEKDLDYRDVKIVQLAKRSRALSAKLEGERARCLKARREADVYARELEACRRKLELVSSAGARWVADKDSRETRAVDQQSSRTGRVAGNEERLRQQVVLLRNKLKEAQDGLKKSYRTLAKEVGGNDVELNRAVTDSVGWKGRAQQIVMLKFRVKQLEFRLMDDQRDTGCAGGNRSRHMGRNDVDHQAQEELHFMERQRVHAMEQLEEKCGSLSEEAGILRDQVMAKGARVTGLEKSNANLRHRVKMLLAKSDTDDRLIDALRCELQVQQNARHPSR